MTNHARVGGILSIVSGAIGVLSLFCWLIMAGVVERGYFNYERMVLQLIAFIYVVMGIICVILGIVAIIGGVFALKKKSWGVALTGAIASAITFFPCGIAAVIFVTMGKREFATPVTPAPQVISSSVPPAAS